jgi:4-oxalmesaconate hydratase
MVIDCHGHYTTAPPELQRWRERQLAGRDDLAGEGLRVGDDRIRESVEPAQLALQRQRGTDLTLFSPTGSGMAHHRGDETASRRWAEVCNDLVHRVCALYPERFAGVCQLPQFPGASPGHCVAELTRCVGELGFVGCILNPDPSGGWWTDPPLSDRWWYPLYEKLVELDVPAMIHTSASCNPAFHTTGAHYINGNTTAFVQLLTSNLFRDLPGLRLVLPHGGGAVPFQWGRYRGLAQELGRPPLEELLLGNVYFDTCVYHQAGIELLTRVVPVDNILFGSEMLGAVRGVDPETGHPFDDTRRYVEAVPWLDDAGRRKIFEDNARRVFPRLGRAGRARAGAIGPASPGA